MQIFEGRKVIVIEGVDATGKSSLETMLSESIGHCFNLHTSAPPKGSNSLYYKNALEKVMEFIKVLNQPIIIDRFYIGEAVYGSYFRDTTLDVQVFERILKRNGVSLSTIYLHSELDVLKERLNKRGDWYIEESHLPELQTLYSQQISLSKFPVYTLDTSKGITEEDLSLILQFIHNS